MRVFLDANVLFSAGYRETGSVRIFFALAESRTCELISSRYAVDEARRIVLAKHPDRIQDLESLVTQLSICAEPSAETIAWAVAQKLPSKDAPILAAAIDARCNVVATGDRTHFGRLYGQMLRGVAVLLPAEAIELLISG